MAGMKANMARSMLGVLRTCLTAAVEEERIMGNPAAQVGKFTGRSRTEVEIFTPKELVCLLQTTVEEMPEAYPLVLTLARTGLRLGEALTLQVCDFDLDRREVSVRRTWGSRTEGLGERRINTPKSGQPRRVDLSKQLYDVLGSYLMTRPSDSSWVFPGKDAWPMTPSAFRYSVWLPLLRQSGVRYRKPHTLRHTFVSMLIQAGESLAYVKEQLGHHSIKITMDVYEHLIPGTRRQRTG
jgi:integrase